VYKAKSSDNTAISEIAFFYKGKKLELDLKLVAKFLEKKTKKQVDAADNSGN
jgi:hypothetical protein